MVDVGELHQRGEVVVGGARRLGLGDVLVGRRRRGRLGRHDAGRLGRRVRDEQHAERAAGDGGREPGREPAAPPHHEAMLRPDRHPRREAQAGVDGVAGRAELARHGEQSLAAGAGRGVLGQLVERFSQRQALGNLITSR